MNTILISNETVGPVDSRLFGQFLERATFGETGPESVADPATGRLPPAVVDMLRSMRIPVIRFPGGSDVDRTDWRDMIDNVPGRAGPRPVTTTQADAITNRFGYDEYFALRDTLGCETIVVLNLMDAVMKRKPLPEAVRDAVGLLAYCNAPRGASLPPGMPDWPAVRARNGHPAPFGSEYVQIGNEWRFKFKAIEEATGLPVGDELARWFVTVLHAFIDAIRAIDPAVKIIIDGHLAKMTRPVLEDATIRDAVRYATFHVYAPGPITRARRAGEPIELTGLTTEDWWYGLTSIPGMLGADGYVRSVSGEPADMARQLGYRIACTEWNWNGWGLEKVASEAATRFRRAFLPDAKAVGVAGFLHGLMRQGRDVDLATQSMLVGHNWDIGAIRVDPAGQRAPEFRVQGLVTALYGTHHGGRLLRVTHDMQPTRAQPFVIGLWSPWPDSVPELALLDVVATAGDDRLCVHVIGRHMDQPTDLSLDLGAWNLKPTGAVRHTVRADTAGSCRLELQPVTVRDGSVRTQVPPRSVCVFEFPLAASPVATRGRV